MIFITYNCRLPNFKNKRFSGLTVTIIEKLEKNFYHVGAYAANGKWVEWDAHVSELNGFTPE